MHKCYGSYGAFRLLLSGAFFVTALLSVVPIFAQDPTSTVEFTDASTIDIRANDTRLVDILQQLADITGRNFVIGDGVDSRRVTLSIRGMTLTEVLDAILPGAGCSYRERGKYIMVDTSESLALQEVVTEPLAVRVIRLKYTRAKDMADMITPFLGPTGKLKASPEAAEGIASGSDSTGGDSLAGHDVLIVEDTPTRLQKIEEVIRSIDVEPMQVVVEATILRAALNDANQLGVDISFLSGVDFERVGATSTGGLNLTTGPVPAGEFDDGVAAVNTSFGGPLNGDGFTFGLIKNNLAVFIRALEQLTDTVVLANPKILALNKQRGQVIVGRRDGYITTTVTETAAVQSVEFLETGTQLTFRPYILDDKRVRMEVHVGDSAGGLTPSDLPFESTTESTSNIIVEDGHTILVGGLFRNSDDVSRSQIPGLGEVPGLGAMFRRSNDQSQREEVMVLLTVHIIKHDPTYQALGERMLEEAETIRLGLRERMQWFGRQKLAEAHARSAIEKMHAGRPEQAWFHARLSLAANPLSSTARRMRDRMERDLDGISPDDSIRQWVARRLNERPVVDRATDWPIEPSDSTSETLPADPGEDRR